MDFIISFVGIVVLLPFFFVLFILASFDTGFPGVFTQERIGRFGKIFTIYKFKTYHSKTRKKSSFGNWMRKTKLDELPQLFNILKGEMSVVGYRPDIAGYYDALKGNDREILQLKPGILSEAGFKYRNEDEILSKQQNSLQYNDEVLFQDKVKMNLQYCRNLSLKNDLKIVMKAVKIVLTINR